MEYIGVAISLITGLFVPAIVIGVIVYIIISMNKNKDSNNKFKLSSKILLQIYLYALSFITLGVAVIGGSIALRAIASYQFDVPFAYTLEKVNTDWKEVEYGNNLEDYKYEECYSGSPVTYYNTQFCFDSNQRKSDLINGVTLLLSMSILFLIHQYAIYKIPQESIIDWIKKIYIFASLIVYSIVSVIAIPTAIYQLVNYILFEVDKDTYTTYPAPAMAIAIVLLAVPLWLYFLRETTKLKED